MKGIKGTVLKHAGFAISLMIGALITSGAGTAAPVTYIVSVNTTPQIGYVDLQFNPGPGAAQATAVIRDLTFSGGGQLLPAVDTVFPLPFNTPAATGSLETEVLIDNTESFNAWLQRVEFGASLRFSVTLSGLALESTGNSGGTDFSVSLYDETGADLFGGPAVLLAISPDGAVGITAADGTDVSTVPEPASLLLAATALGGLLWVRRFGGAKE